MHYYALRIMHSHQIATEIHLNVFNVWCSVMCAPACGTQPLHAEAGSLAADVHRTAAVTDVTVTATVAAAAAPDCDACECTAAEHVRPNHNRPDCRLHTTLASKCIKKDFP